MADQVNLTNTGQIYVPPAIPAGLPPASYEGRAVEANASGLTQEQIILLSQGILIQADGLTVAGQVDSNNGVIND